MKILTSMLAGMATLSLCTAAHCGVSTQEAEQLKTTLTPIGAERAANKDGSIPAWSGGMTTLPAGAKAGDRRFDPFAGDKPLFTITAANMGQYAEKLSEGAKALLQRYPQTFRIDVYPTRRTAAAPQWVYDNTLKNATRAKLANDGLTLEGAYGGVPFPIPKTGNEVRWNHLMVWRGESVDERMKVWSITPSGKAVLASEASVYSQFPYYGHGTQAEGKYNGNYIWSIQATDAPAFRAGEAILLRQPTDYRQDNGIWQYLAGQRRVRKAPNVGFDTPDFVSSGTNFFDEAFGGFGSPERYDFKLVGKKEMFIPYNTNKLLMVKDEDAMAANHLKPENVRWELHRVWVVEATLKEGKRHAVPHRVSYHDEDTWNAALMDGWDAQGHLWRTSMILPFVAPDLPAVVSSCRDAFFNLQSGAWVYRCAMGDSAVQYKPVALREESFYTPDALAASRSR